MPPKPTTNKEAILSAAVFLVREQGMENVNARSIASKLNRSTKPLFRVYENMDALKQDVIAKLNLYYNTFMGARISDDNRLLAQGIAYIEFARQEKNIFNTLFMDKTCAGKNIEEILNADWNQRSIMNAQKITGLSLANARSLFRDVWLYSHGIATQIVSDDINIPPEEVVQLMKNVFHRFSLVLEDENMNEIPEKMDEFFNTRADIYDVQQIKSIDGEDKCYHEIAKYIPTYTKTLLDLGCGTGLELESIFNKFPKMDVTGIDLADKMLEKLAAKYFKHSINLINGNYFIVDMGTKKYDTAISVMSFHHFTHSQKKELYTNICRCLKNNGVFIECDYMVGSNNSTIETHFLSERKKLLTDNNLTEDLYHYDIPFTIEHEMSLLTESGFQSVKKVWGIENTIMLLATKQEKK
ncbi:class I SAM-dependent methyltransferase [Pectinatus frisingensis]|uniref:class I SAM-dependent methyltransferase n=1 Tax=Pectinatus frisingensis TaxID=865 RepID=UPI0018C4EC55|nr:class I SAM-dependent methyltransferase [Pectinatus frisingensis]